MYHTAATPARAAPTPTALIPTTARAVPLTAAARPRLAIVAEPAVLFADEPTGNLDTARSIEIMELLVEFNRTRSLTVLMVTHEQDMAAYASRTIRFRDGHVESDERHQAYRS